MLLKMIGCEVFTREICHCIARSPHVVDVEFTDKGAHERSDYLRQLLQERIDATSNGAKAYDAILLGFGLCGNATSGLEARKIPLVLPRAHDCCTLFLGSRQAFREHFGDNPSCPFTSAGYLERGDSYVHEASVSDFLGLNKTLDELIQKYGEENGRYVFETLHPPSHDDRVVFIELPELAHLGYAEKCRQQAEADDKRFVLLPGSMRLIEKQLFGDWDEEFQIVPPGHRVAAVYDWRQIVKAEPAESE